MLLIITPTPEGMTVVLSEATERQANLIKNFAELVTKMTEKSAVLKAAEWIATLNGITVEQLLEPNRNAPHVEIKRTLCYLIHKYSLQHPMKTERDLPKNFDRCNVYYHYEKVLDYMATMHDYSEKILQIEKNFCDYMGMNYEL